MSPPTDVASSPVVPPADRRSGDGADIVVELDEVSKTYASEPPVKALRGVNFSVRAGELLGIVGPSGSGKSTLLHLMGTLDRPSTGIVRLTGLDVAEMADRELSALRATRIGFVFQQFSWPSTRPPWTMSPTGFCTPGSPLPIAAGWQPKHWNG